MYIYIFLFIYTYLSIHLSIYICTMVRFEFRLGERHLVQESSLRVAWKLALHARPAGLDVRRRHGHVDGARHHDWDGVHREASLL